MKMESGSRSRDFVRRKSSRELGALGVISQTGKRLKDFPVETNGQALVEAVRTIPGRKVLVFEGELYR